jgi:L-iditol 2-dehydrogenase
MTLSEQQGTAALTANQRAEALAHGTRGTMRAALALAPGLTEVREIDRPSLQPHEILVRVQAVGICGTDIHIAAGHANYNFDSNGRPIPLPDHPQILGHEISGIVEEVGSAVEDVVPGVRGVVDQGRTCVGERRPVLCEYCATGDSHQCEHYQEHGITGLPGGFAEFVAVPAANLVPIESDLDPSVAALAEPLGCIVHSAEMLARSAARYSLGAGRPEHRVRTVLICGAGPSGLLFIQYLRNEIGFEGLLLVSAPNARKRALAEGFGATTIDPSAVDLVDAVRDHTCGRRVELLIEASGSGPVIQQLPGLLRKQATLMLYGHGHLNVPFAVMNSVQFMEPTFVSPTGASGGFEENGRPSVFVGALRLIEEGRIEIGALISHRYGSLDAIPKALEHDYRLPEYVKGVVSL